MSGRERGGKGPGPPVFRYDGGRLAGVDHRPVAEHPVALTVNGREIATLIASPHDLRFLVAGFLRMQGLVGRPEEIEILSVCEEFGAATVRIRRELPERLKPIVTSGCGGGIAFDIPGAAEDPAGGAGNAERRGTRAGDTARIEGGAPIGGGRFSPDDLFGTMEELARLAEGYKGHGGIHSAAVADGRRAGRGGRPTSSGRDGRAEGEAPSSRGGAVLLYAEDIGRHNTIDRIAGEALLKGIDLSGKMLVTSGRVSSEMAVKAAFLGIALIASRTSPTDLAVRICAERGITLVGYVRGGRFNVYAHPWRIALPGDRIEGVTGVILAGGASSRMGSNKALLPYQGGRFIEAIHETMAGLFREVILVTNTPELYDFLPCRKEADIFPGMGSLAGIHAGLCRAATPHVFVVACDMPHLDGNLVRALSSLKDEADIVIPESDTGLEPLCAVYGRGAAGAIEEALRAGQRKVVSFLDRVKVRVVPREEVARIDPGFRSFRNINTPEEYFEFREGEKPPCCREAKGAGNRAESRGIGAGAPGGAVGSARKDGGPGSRRSPAG